MGKYIKYFETAAEFAEFWNFGEWAPGPGDDDDTTMVAFVSEYNAVYYDNSDMSEFDVSFSAQNPEIDATAETVTFQIKTGLFWLEVYHNGELVSDYRPGEDMNEDYSVDANLSPLTLTENFVGKWYRDNNGAKGDYITEFEQPITHLPDPNADPVKFTIEAQSQTLEDAGTICLGNASLTGATSMLMEDEGSWRDISSDVYISNRRLYINVFAGGYWLFKFEFEVANFSAINSNLFSYSELETIGVETNYPELGEEIGFTWTSPIGMNSQITDVTLGEGLRAVGSATFMSMNKLGHIVLGDNYVLPNVSGSFIMMPSSGELECNPDAQNFSKWSDALPAGWDKPQISIAKAVLTFDIDVNDNPNPIVGSNTNVSYEFSGDMQLSRGDGYQYSSDVFRLVEDNGVTRLEIDGVVDGTYYLTLRRVSADLLLQGWLAGGEYRIIEYTEESFKEGDTHISLHSQALSNCQNLEEVYLGAGLTSVCANSFDGSEGINQIYVYAENEPSINDGSTFLTLSDGSGYLYVPSGADYSNWSAALGQDWTVEDSL